MITNTDLESKEVTTTGCSCCSVNLSLESEREDILAEVKWNIINAKECLDALNVDFLTFCIETLK